MRPAFMLLVTDRKPLETDVQTPNLREVGIKRLMVVCGGARFLPSSPAAPPPDLASPFSSSSSTTRRSPLLNCFVSSRRSCAVESEALPGQVQAT